jgi:hypothetical protein
MKQFLAIQLCMYPSFPSHLLFLVLGNLNSPLISMPFFSSQYNSQILFFHIKLFENKYSFILSAYIY